MPTMDELYTALRNADAAGDTAAAQRLAAHIKNMGAQAPETSMLDSVKQGAGNLAAGALRGAGSIGATIMWPWDKAQDMYHGDTGPTISSLITGKMPETRNEKRRNLMDRGLSEMGAEPESLLYKGGKLGAEVAGTAGAGGVLANGARAAGAAPSLVQALATSGMRAGGATGAAGLAARTAGGAASGGAAAAMIDPDYFGTGAAIGGALPGSLSLLGATGGYAGRLIGSVVKPFTKKGQEGIAGSILNRFAEGGPTAPNLSELVPGSRPTLAEATQNAGLAGLQRTARDLNPNAFVEREMANNAARTSAFDGVAGDAAQLDFYKASRGQAAKELYDKALNRVPEAATPYVKGQVTQLLKRPSIDKASRTAQSWALERGEKPYMNGSLPALHDVKTALDDMIEEAVRAGKGGHAKALGATKDKLINVMEKLSPEYGEARTTYAAMSKPVNEMEALQGLKLTDKMGNITLAKVQNAIKGLEMSRSTPGFNNAKAIDPEKLQSLYAIRDDLLRKEATGLGKSAGSNTFQNFATDNILTQMLPGKLGTFVKDKAGGAVGQIGRLAYSGPNEQIRNQMMDMMLDPALAQRAMQQGGRLNGPMDPRTKALMDFLFPPAARTAPLLGTDQ